MPKQAQADAMVIFGITGDLARKMTFHALYRLEANGTLTIPVIGVGRQEWSDDDLRKRARESIEADKKEIDEKIFEGFAKRLSYVQGDYAKPETYERVKEAIAHAKNPAFYLEIPPSLFEVVVNQLADAGLTENARVVIEKPFGHDLESARELNRNLHELLDEEQIYRIDHFLGKEPVMDITYLRFGNSVFEPIWNRSYVHSVQITMGEDFGVEDRGSFYDPVGALRDVVQNHLLQVLALTAMEPPAKGSDLDPVRHAKDDLFKAIPSVDPKHCVRGQYKGYRKVEGVDPRSETETFVALRLEIQNWRWWGVPFFIRAGKALAAKVTEVRVILQSPPPVGIGGEPTPETDEIVLRIDPDPGAFFLLEAKSPGEDKLRRVHLDLLFEEQFGGQPGAYERLLCDALRGDQQGFSLQDTVEETWRIVEPLIEKPPPVVPYEPGSWGPTEADEVMPKEMRGWREPWLPENPAS